MSSDAYVGEIRIFAGNFAPTGWALCNGQLLAISSNTALFSILGTTYGGNGTSNFGLPNLQGRTVIQQGHGPGLSLIDLGEQGGAETTTLSSTNIPSHTHNINVANNNSNSTATVANNYLSGQTESGESRVSTAKTTNATANILTISNSLGTSSIPFAIRSPYLAITYIIALQGVYPPRS